MIVETSPISSILDSMDEEEEQSEGQEDFFGDIKKLKRKVVHDRETNLVQVDTLSPKGARPRAPSMVEPPADSI